MVWKQQDMKGASHIGWGGVGWGWGGSIKQREVKPSTHYDHQQMIISTYCSQINEIQHAAERVRYFD